MDTTSPSTLASGFWFPTDASSQNFVDAPAIFILWICGIFLVFNAGLMVFFAVRYRQQKKASAATGATHNTALEVTWSVIPAFILAIIFIWGFRNFLKMETPPNNAYDVMVTGYKWGWNFTYPDGHVAKAWKRPGQVDPDPPALHAPAGQPVRLTLQSQDVIHSVFIPQLRVKKDCVPGRFNQMWFQAKWDDKNVKTRTMTDKEGNQHELRFNEYDLFCTEYCGQNHSLMITKVYIYETRADFDLWRQCDKVIPDDYNLIELGREIYAVQCASCHSLDGSNAANYPSWLNLYGTTGHATSAGVVEVDDPYIYESIRNPAAKLAPKPSGGTYGNQMAAFPNLTDREIRAIIEFMKTVSDKVEADEDMTYGDLNVDGTPKGEEGADGEETEDGDAPEGEGDGEAPEGEYEAEQAAAAR